MMMVYKPLLHPLQIARAINIVDHIFLFRGNKLKIQLQERNQNTTNTVNQRHLSGNQEIMPICGLTFQVKLSNSGPQ